MVKGQKKNYWSYRRYRKSQFNKVASNYTKVRFDKSYRILLSHLAINFAETNQPIISLTNMIQGSPDFQMYRQLYQSMKITGFALYVTPMLRSNNYAGMSTVALALQTDNDGNNVGNVVESDKSIILNFQTPSRAYWSMHSGSTGWIALDDLQRIPGKISVAVDDLPTGGEAYWVVKVSFWVLLKNKD